MGSFDLGTTVSNLWQQIRGRLTEPFFSIGDDSFSAASVVKMLVFVIVLISAARWVRRALVRRLFPHTQLGAGTGEALANVTFYAMISVGLLVGIQASGVDLSALTVVFGALGLGVGFGLQTIASNFISGLIILVEQPIRVGDRIQLGELHGRVVRIRGRATEIRTNDAISVIVPNSEFISQQVINWSHGSDAIRMRVGVGVAYGSDVERVRTALLEAAAAVDGALKEPAPRVWLAGFGDSALNFELLSWTSELLHNRGEFMSRMNFAIHASLERHGIQIPFPQRDLHLRTGRLLADSDAAHGGAQPAD